jgi:hypothetical protein
VPPPAGRILARSSDAQPGGVSLRVGGARAESAGGADDFVGGLRVVSSRARPSLQQKLLFLRRRAGLCRRRLSATVGARERPNPLPMPRSLVLARLREQPVPPRYACVSQLYSVG